MTQETLDHVRQEIARGVPLTRIARDLGLSYNTFKLRLAEQGVVVRRSVTVSAGQPAEVVTQ